MTNRLLDAGATLPHAAGSRPRMALTLEFDPLEAERSPPAGRRWALDRPRPRDALLLAPGGPIVSITGHDRERMRILVIEDNAKLAQTIKASLEQHGYSIDVARTAKEGDEIALVEHHDLIVLDVMLPDGDGVELCRQLRRQKVTTPILMLTVLSATTDKVAGLDAGADDYLTKPFQLDELLARLRSLLRRSQAQEGAMLQSGDLVMDLHEHQVTLAGALVKLSAKEFALLEFMMRNPRKLLSRAMISESVWDMNYESSSNVIDVYVSSLRRKVDRSSQKPRIETVIGSGYRFLDYPEEKDAPARGAPAT